MNLGSGGVNVKLPSLYSQYHCNTTEEHLNGYILGHAHFRFVQRVGRETAAQVRLFAPFMLPARREFGDVREALEDRTRALPGPDDTEGTVEKHVDDAVNEIGVQTRRGAPIGAPAQPPKPAEPGDRDATVAVAPAPGAIPPSLAPVHGCVWVMLSGGASRMTS